MTLKKVTFLSILSLILYTGCSRDISSSSYGENEAMEVTRTVKGKIINIRKVKVKGSESMGDNPAGLIAGGLGGGILGSQFGGGSGKTIGALAGAALGALGGSAAERAFKNQDAIEYIVQLQSGHLETVTQGPEPLLTKGQKVFVLYGTRGRSRVIPATE